MAAMKTPGVYIVEKNAFPNSVVEVATAVPAFIGYTEKADNHNTPLSMKPWRISSMGEYAQYFGGPPKPLFEVKAVAAGEDSHFSAETRADDPKSAAGYVLSKVKGSKGGDYGLYNALRHFFQNNGGACYIVSVGNYTQELDADAFTAGIDELLKEQEPTMLVIPEAVRFDRDTCTAIQQAMLSHCGDRMRNRVAILDVWGGDKPRNSPEPDGDPVAKFRNSLGINFLNFASAYYPWLNTGVVGEKELSFENIANSSAATVKQLLRAELKLPDARPDASKPQQRSLFDAIEGITADLAKTERAALRYKAIIEKAKAAKKTLDEAKAAQAALAARTEPAPTAEETAAAGTAVTEAQAALTAAGDPEAAKQALSAVENTLQDPARQAAIDKAKADGGDAAAQDAAAKAWDEAEALLPCPLTTAELAAAVESRHALLNKTLANASGVFNTILTEIRRQLNILAPSAAMAGVYTMVDNTRGVWKAPANVSLNGVISPTVSISAVDQEDLNVTAQGKSINAIRSFIGEGVLVWGGRTLDGNSLDWRYINVRRTMIMLEESCRLAAKAMVFEPNVANTWVTIKSMITNFLTSIWKRGGLMGAVPEDAFSVHVGLGETMTPDDVLEGILRVTVLVAMVRPAEFIEITFQQQMPKS